MRRKLSPPACRFSTNAISTCAGRLPRRVIAFRVLASPALVRFGDGDAFLLRERGHDGDDHVAHHSAAIEERFLETAPAYSPIVQLLEMSQCLPHALTAEAI
jgi:hypothetical protein